MMASSGTQATRWQGVAGSTRSLIVSHARFRINKWRPTPSGDAPAVAVLEGHADRFEAGQSQEALGGVTRQEQGVRMRAGHPLSVARLVRRATRYKHEHPSWSVFKTWLGESTIRTTSTSGPLPEPT